jgi:hypothetical protein
MRVGVREVQARPVRVLGAGCDPASRDPPIEPRDGWGSRLRGDAEQSWAGARSDGAGAATGFIFSVTAKRCE